MDALNINTFTKEEFKSFLLPDEAPNLLSKFRPNSPASWLCTSRRACSAPRVVGVWSYCTRPHPCTTEVSSTSTRRNQEMVEADKIIKFQKTKGFCSLRVTDEDRQTEAAAERRNQISRHVECNSAGNPAVILHTTVVCLTFSQNTLPSRRLLNTLCRNGCHQALQRFLPISTHKGQAGSHSILQA